jgi:hypothetical protein
MRKFSCVSSPPALGNRVFPHFSQLPTILTALSIAGCAFLLLYQAHAQVSAEKPAPQGQSGMSTGVAHPAVKDDQSRPITAGGFVDGAPVIFSNITHAAGLDRFHHKSGTSEKTTILETPGSGVALLDYDQDGWLDIYIVNGSTFPALAGKEAAPKAMLLHNNHDGTFTDVTDKAGVANQRWGFGAAWGDYDHDGLLDLFVPGYVKFDPANPPIAGKGSLPPGFCQFRGINVMCGPRGLPGEGDHLFHNNGNGTFTDVSAKAGVSDPRGYYGLASVFVDVDDDGWIDLLVANDSVPKYLYRNKHDGTFEDVSYLSGFALNDEGREQAAMGIAVGDYNGDGKVDFHITNFSDDYNTLYRNDGEASFTDVSFAAGLASVTIPFLGWGTGFLDFDNDGLLDIFAANGHVYPGVDQQDWGTTWAQRPLLFRNVKGTKFEEVPPATGSGLAMPVSARGAAFGDLFNDGKIDVVLNVIDGTPLLLRNVVKNSNHWLELQLVGGQKSPRDAIGAKVFVTAGGVRRRGDVFSGGSYASSSDLRLHFGLGSAAKIDKVEIHWPSGAKEEVRVPSVDRIFKFVEGRGLVEP